jgi:hypothetical protein
MGFVKHIAQGGKFEKAAYEVLGAMFKNSGTLGWGATYGGGFSYFPSFGFAPYNGVSYDEFNYLMAKSHKGETKDGKKFTYSMNDFLIQETSKVDQPLMPIVAKKLVQEKMYEYLASKL